MAFPTLPSAPRVTLEDARRQRTRGDFWESSRGRLHVVARGPEKSEHLPLLLLHGYSDNASTWRRLQRHLEGEFRTIAIDMPGHGLSDTPSETALTMGDLADLVREYMDAHAIPRAFVVASSLGGGTALGLGAKYGPRVTGMLLLGSVGVPFLPPAAFAPLFLPRVEGIAALVASLPGLRRALLARIAFPNGHAVSDQDVGGYFDPWTIEGRVHYFKRLGRKLDLGEPVPWLSQIQVPVTVVDCGRDHLVPSHVSKELVKRIPGAIRVELPTAGHLPQIDSTEEVGRLVRFALARSEREAF